jgi:hypothetical protein
MANTTNYNWETPDDTDLVKDGALAIRTLGSAVDTTTKALNPSTTLGDIEYRSATANTNTRLGIGTTGQVLSVVGGVPSWSTAAGGDFVLLNTASFTTASAVSLPNDTFTSTYANYRLIVKFTATSSNYFTLRLRASGADDTGNNYYSTYAYFYYGSNGISADDRAAGATSWSRMGYTESSGQHNGVFDIFSPQEAVQTNISGLYNRSTVGCNTAFGYKGDTNVFDSLSLIPAAGTITGSYSIYGYKK